MARKEKPKVKMIGQDGNIFNLLGIAGRVLEPEARKEMTNRVYESGSYMEALAIISEYVDIE